MGSEDATTTRAELSGYQNSAFPPPPPAYMAAEPTIPMYGYPPASAVYDYAGYHHPQQQWGLGYAPESYYPLSASGPSTYATYDTPIPPTTARRTLHSRQRLHRSGADELDTQLFTGGPREPPAKNQLDLEAIESGADTRTTVMVKNIPNKMSDRDLLGFIGKVCPRRIDFLYLRMDFQNGEWLPSFGWGKIRADEWMRIGCNVGYAFVNFITVQDLLHFAKTQLGVKW